MCVTISCPCGDLGDVAPLLIDRVARHGHLVVFEARRLPAWSHRAGDGLDVTFGESGLTFWVRGAPDTTLRGPGLTY